MRTLGLPILLVFMLTSRVHASVSLIDETATHYIFNVNERYTLGDNDTISSAKSLSLESIKRSAADFAGTRVESELKLTNRIISESKIRIVAAAFVEVLSVEFQRVIIDSAIVIISRAKVTISKQSINDGLNKLKTDPERQALIASLERKNNELQAKLVSLTMNINQNDRLDLLDARELVLSNLDSNRNATKQVFTRGTLFQLAQLDNSVFELARQDIDENVFGYLVHQTKIKMGTPSFIQSIHGKYDVKLKLEWHAEMLPVKQVLARYFKLDDKPRNSHVGSVIPQGIGIRNHQNSGNNSLLDHTEKLKTYLRNHIVAIEVDSVYKRSYLPIGTLTGGFGNDTYAIQFSNDSKKNIMVKSTAKNPIVIKGLTKAQLENINSLSAKVVIIDRRTWRGSFVGL
ncbi:hypothetical protein QF117_13345 [Vibrio sp. YMD68]|uniref:hypothetical protein n=1 Tax=Vibrio sp. YMD68 TaxID=3042300 RepID=UPI00249CE6FE|nr:hypothetical protein [Vibrio sp. YMD68]WGW01756.1 hypothetical protein QF117_13345 [Vibrio sp. YMD68]